MKKLANWLRSGKRNLILLIALIPWLLSGCVFGSKSAQCKPPEVTPWMMEQQPLELNLTPELFKTLSD